MAVTIVKPQQESALRVIQEQIQEAIHAPKCHGCGCLHKTVESIAQTPAGQNELSRIVERARSVFRTKEYDCLGCSVCYPANAANAFVEAFPETGAALDLCPTEIPAVRSGWPPLPGDYHVVRYGAPVAVCTLNSESLAAGLSQRAPDGLSIAGTLHTENLGIERIIRNTLANPNIRFLVVCGEDTRQAVGHLPGQSLESLFRNGIDKSGRIIAAKGRRPVLKNVSLEQIRAFRSQVELISMIGEEREALILDQVENCRRRDPGPVEHAIIEHEVEVIQAVEPLRLTLDEAGYLVVYPDRKRSILAVEHYTNAGLLDCVIEGLTPAAVYSTVIERGLVTRLDHAAYLGRELARVEESLKTGRPYVQDRAPGRTLGRSAPTSCTCGDAKPEVRTCEE